MRSWIKKVNHQYYIIYTKHHEHAKQCLFLQHKKEDTNCFK